MRENSSEQPKQTKSLAEFIRRVKDDQFNSKGHEIVSQKHLDKARLLEAKTRLGTLSFLKKQGKLEGTPEEWQELKQLYLDLFKNFNHELEVSDKEAVNRIDEAFSLEPTYIL